VIVCFYIFRLFCFNCFLSLVKVLENIFLKDQMNLKKTEIRLNKEMNTKLEEYEAVVCLLLIYVHALPKEVFHGILSRSEKLEASRLIRKIGRRDAKAFDLPHKVKTIFDWLPDLTKNKKRKGVKRLTQAAINFVLRMAAENFNVGYKTIFGVMRNLGFVISRSSIIRILRENGYPPFKRKSWAWSEKLKATAKWTACDFAKFEIDTGFGKKMISILFFIHAKTRKIHIAGFTENPDAQWTKNQIVAATMADIGFLDPNTRLVHDGDGCFVNAKVKAALESVNIESVKIPPFSPDCNPFAERFVRTLREQCLDRLIFVSENRLRSALRDFEIFYNQHRNHQGIGNILIDEDEREGLKDNTTGKIKRNLHHYYREAA